MITEYKLVICGSRSFLDYPLLKKEVDRFLCDTYETSDLVPVPPRIVIISGAAPGADLLGEKYAQEYGYEVRRFPADWDKYGKQAGYIRNEQMVIIADGVIAFWNHKSKGTKHTISLSKKYNKNLKVVLFGCTTYLRNQSNV